MDWQVLQAIHRLGAAPQHKLAEVIGRQRSTLNGAVQRLLATGWLVRAGQAIEGRGRPAILLAVNREQASFVGVDLTADEMHLAVAAADGMLLEQVSTPLSDQRGADQVLDQIDLNLRGLLSRAQTDLQRLSAIWAGINGAVDDHGVVVTCASLGWKNVPLRELLAKRFGCEVLVQGGASVLNASAEWLMGAAREADSFVYYHAGRGISARFLRRGQLLPGATRRAGEFGHVVVEPGGPRCACGNRGCLEAVASGPALAAAIGRIPRRELPASVRRLLRPSVAGRPAAIVRAACTPEAGKSHPALAELIERAGTHLALGASMAIAAYDPEVLVLGGYLFEANPTLVEHVRSSLQSAVLDWDERGLRVERGQVMSGDRAVAGAAEMCQRFWANPRGVVAPG